MNNDASIAEIQFALEADEGMQFLQLWNEGEFDEIRRNWDDVPEEVFIGADPLHSGTKALMQEDAAKVCVSVEVLSLVVAAAHVGLRHARAKNQPESLRWNNAVEDMKALLGSK